MIRTITVTASALLSFAMASAAQATPSEADYQRCQTLHDRFNEARARQDGDAMAAVFAQDAIRVTPDGVFQGRDAIRRNLESLIRVGLHDFTSERTVSRQQGELLFDAGTWSARLGDVPLHGYYSALLSCGGEHQEILEETTNVAAPPPR